MDINENVAMTIKELVQKGFENPENREKLLQPLSDLCFNRTIADRLLKHFQEEQQLIEDIFSAVSKKNGITHCTVMPIDENEVQIYKKGLPLFHVDDAMTIYGYDSVPEKIVTSREQVEEVIREHCVSHFDVPKDHRLSELVVLKISCEAYPYDDFTFDIENRCCTDAAIKALRKAIPAFDDDEAREALEEFSHLPEVQDPYLEQKYSCTINIPVSVNRNGKEVFSETLKEDHFSEICKSANLSGQKLFDAVKENTHSNPHLSFLVELPLADIIHLLGNDVDIKIPKNSRVGVYDPVVGMCDSFTNTTSKPITLNAGEFDISVDYGNYSVHKILNMPETETFDPVKKASKSVSR